MPSNRLARAFSELAEWRGRIRDRAFTSPRFLHWAETFLLTRPIARAEANALFDLCSGFVYSQTLAACVELRLFEVLRASPATAADIALATGLTKDAALRLLTGACALRLVENRPQHRFGLGRLGAAVLASPGLRMMIEHHSLLYRDLADPVSLLQAKAPTNLAAYWPYAAGIPAAPVSGVPDYTALMAATQPALADEILDAVPFNNRRCLMDVGGGDGTFLIQAGQRHSHLSLRLFDLAPVAEIGRGRVDGAKLTARTTVIAGNFLTDALPPGADTVTLIRILLDHGDETVRTILSNVHRSLPKGGLLVVAEPMAGTKGAEKVAAYFSLYLLAMGCGRPRTETRLRALLLDAGFSRIRSRATRQPLLTRILTAHA